MDTVDEYHQYLLDLTEQCQTNNDRNACYDLGKTYLMGRPNHPPDLKKAKNFFILGCEKNSGKSCSVVSVMLRNKNEGAETEESKKYWSEAQRLLTHECEIENEPNACMFWGMQLLKFSQDPIRDFPVALQFLERCCKLGQSVCCVNAGTIFLNYAKDVVKAKEYFERACSLDNGDACWLLGEEIEKENNANSNQDKSHFGYYKKACELQCLEGCLAYGTEMIKEEKFDEALESLTTACDKDESNGCLLGGLLLLSTNNFSHARQLFLKGCRLGHTECCDYGRRAGKE